MGTRLGVGATSASAIIFSILLVSNLLVFASSQDRERLLTQADEADSLADGATALVGAGATNILVRSQGFLSSGPLGCSTAVGSAASFVNGLTDIQRSAGLVVVTSAVLVDAGSVNDNLPLLSPFNGTVPGEFDISLESSVTGGLAAAGVSFTRSESHIAHLPLRLEKLVGDCTAGLNQVSETLSATTVHNCTIKFVSPVVARAIQGAEAAAAADGFQLVVSYTLVQGPPCGIDFRVSVAQEGVQGPGGGFSTLVEEGGFSYFGQ